MWRYVVKRLLLLIPVVLGAILIIFFVLSFSKGTPAEILLGPGFTQEEYDAYNDELGFNDPFFVRYFRYVGNLLKGDFGTSYYYKTTVWSELQNRIPISLRTTFMALAMAALIGVPLGVLTAVKQYSALDTIPTAMAMVFAATPVFWLGMLLMYFFAVKLGWFSTLSTGKFSDLILPTLSLGLPHAARQMRFTRSSMLEAIREDYVRTARAKGCKESSVIWHHTVKNALLPVITVIGNSFGAMFGGTVIIEKLFVVNGIGSLMVKGIGNRDVPIVTGCVVIIALVYSFVTMIVDILYAYIDPRTKARFIK